MRNLSIIIPFYNKYEALYKTHQELKLQLHPDDEIIVVDDYSPDGKPEIKCDCTKIIQPPEKLTPHEYRLCTLRNLGLKEAKYDSCLVIDPDCMVSPHFVETARYIFDPSILFTGQINYIQKDGGETLDPRLTSKGSIWIDIGLGQRNGDLVWGGNMLFSKSRTALIGWFDEDFNKRWGAEEHEFASKCFHSGMRLYYSTELLVTHLWHEKERPGYGDNMALWRDKVSQHREHLNISTPYQPAVGVCITTMLRPKLLDQCLRAVFRNILPVKVRLVVNGDNSAEMKRALEPWRKWAVEVVNQERKEIPVVYNEAMTWARNNNYKYLVNLDDDITVDSNAITSLVKTMEADENIFACAGYLRDARKNEVMLGGPITNDQFSFLKKQPGVYNAKWIGSGFTIYRLDEILPYDESYEMGYNDYDWCMYALSSGKAVAVSGNAGAYHKVQFTSDGIIQYRNPPEYKAIRYDSQRHERMAKKFRDKWGFEPRMGPIVE